MQISSISFQPGWHDLFFGNTNIFCCIVTQLEAENEVNNEMANRMSLFYAEATPMLKTLSNATTKFVSEVQVLLCFQNGINAILYCLLFSRTRAKYHWSDCHSRVSMSLEVELN